MPKKRASRNAVSAVTDRSPLTIAPMRVAGTRNAIARAFTDIPSGLRNSSLSTSPGWVVTRCGVGTPLVVIDDFDIARTLLGPDEADAPLIVDADRVLPSAISRERFEIGSPEAHASRFVIRQAYSRPKAMARAGSREAALSLRFPAPINAGKQNQRKDECQL